MLSLKNKVILVTGGAGFVGSHLVDALTKEQPEHIIIVDDMSLGSPANLTAIESCGCDITCEIVNASVYQLMQETMRGHGVDVVFNLAVRSLPASLVSPRQSFGCNTAITSTMCELLRDGMYDTLVHFSSSEVYGTNQHPTVPMAEHHPICPTTPYAASKAASDMLIQSYRETYGVDCTILRPFNLFGPRQNSDQYAAMIPATIMRMLCGRRPVICGDGKQTRDYTYVSDIVRAAIDMYKCPATRGRVVNVGSGKSITMHDVIIAIQDEMGRVIGITHQPARPGDVRHHIADARLASTMIGYEPRTSFLAGIMHTVEWYDKIARWDDMTKTRLVK